MSYTNEQLAYITYDRASSELTRLSKIKSFGWGHFSIGRILLCFSSVHTKQIVLVEIMGQKSYKSSPSKSHQCSPMQMFIEATFRLPEHLPSQYSGLATGHTLESLEHM